MVRRTHHFSTMTFWLFVLCGICAIASCSTKVDQTTESGDKKNGDVEKDEQESEPQPCSGVNLVNLADESCEATHLLDYRNARARCGFKDQGSNRFALVCDAVVVKKDGSEIRAKGLKTDVSIAWQTPKSVAGSEIKKIECEEKNKGLSLACNLTLAAREPSTVQVDLNLSQGTLARTESDSVQLPYWVFSFGLVNEVPRIFDKLNKENPLKLSNEIFEKVGFQTISVSAFGPNVPMIDGVCLSNGRLFFHTDQYVYEFNDGNYKIYAGSANATNAEELSHRLRVRIYKIKSIACDKNAVYILEETDAGSSVANHRILKITDEKPVEVLIRKGLHASTSKISLNSEGKIFWSDSYQISTLSSDGKVQAVAGSGERGFTGDGGPATSAKLKAPQAPVFIDRSFYFADTGNQVIRKVDKNGIITTMTNDEAKSYKPENLAYDGDKSLIFIDKAHFTLRKINLSSGALTKFAGSGIQGLAGNGISAVDADLSGIENPVVDDFGNVYIASQLLTEAVVRRIDKAGMIRIQIQRTDAGYPGLRASQDFRFPIARDIAIASPTEFTLPVALSSVLYKMNDKSQFAPSTKSSKLESPQGVFHDGNDVLIADDHRHQILIYKGDDSFEVLAGSGAQGQIGANDGVLAKAADLSNPIRIKKGPDGLIYFLESIIGQASAIRRISTDGKLETFFADDLLSGIIDFEIASDGTLFIADRPRNEVRKVLPSKEVFVIAGSGKSIKDSEYADELNLLNVSALALDGRGYVYIADEDASKVYLLKPTTENSNRYKREVFFGGARVADCGSGLNSQGDIASGEAKNKIQASMSVLCVSKPVALDVKDFCKENSTRVWTIVQNFGSLIEPTSNVIKIATTCDVN